MACINASVRTIANDLSASVVTIGGGITAYQHTTEQAKVGITTLEQQVRASASRIGDGLNASSTRLGERLKATVSIICSLAEFVAFLKVSPDEVQWITDDMGVFYEVESNVEWIVLTS